MASGRRPCRSAVLARRPRPRRSSVRAGLRAGAHRPWDLEEGEWGSSNLQHPRRGAVKNHVVGLVAGDRLGVVPLNWGVVRQRTT